MESRNRGGRPRLYPELNGPFNEWIDQAMKEQGIRSYNEFADKYGIGRSTLSNLRRGRQSPTGNWIKTDLRTLERLAVALGRPLTDVIERYYESENKLELIRPKVPLVGWVGAGPGQLVEEDGIYVEPELAKGRDLIAFRVYGDSGCAGRFPICHNDIILVDRNDQGRPNWPVVARLNDGTYVCKLLKVERGGSYLISANPMASNGPTTIPLQEVDQVIGSVVEVRRRM
ncbi:MAG: helix-turn-helix domain-containing protein [Meiothermus ruber]|uniref:LexA family protein n=1 Tax=Meiothermus ruber TaxID=277 RepID=UPI0023F68C60|nr:S24 family peptidase [Meiothermus ruber]MCL6529663.1 helix-turn-helix domain-containing protein [Meiothermus ruber]